MEIRAVAEWNYLNSIKVESGHLGYFTISVPAGDYARLEEAMNTIDSFFFDKVVLHLDRCDRAKKTPYIPKTVTLSAPG